MSRSATELLDLEPNWDSYGGVVIDPDAVRRAEAFVALLAMPPSFVPCSDGGVEIEWNSPEGHLNVSFSPGLDGVYLTFNDHTEEWELAA